MAENQFWRDRGQALSRTGVGIKQRQEVAGQCNHIAFPVTQCWHVHGEHGEAIPQVLAQPAFCDCRSGIAIGRGDDAHIDADITLAAHTAHGAGLKYPQEPRLHCQGHFGNFVQEQGTAGGSLKAAFMGAHGAGEAASFEAEQFCLDKVRRKCGTVDRYQRALAALARLVNGQRRQFLAGAALTNQEHGRLGRRHFLQLAVKGLHGGG